MISAYQSAHRNSRRYSLPAIPMSPLPYVVRPALTPFARPVRCRSHSSHVPIGISPSTELSCSSLAVSPNTSPSCARSQTRPGKTASQYLLPDYSSSPSFLCIRPFSPTSPHRPKSSLSALIESSEFGFRDLGAIRQRRRSSVSFCGAAFPFDKVGYV
uniref:Uncharacterized protein n=1 Tax=Ascaris lumbricoides TaxID=6252 RepID=A0A0M3I454_ASCLU